MQMTQNSSTLKDVARSILQYNSFLIIAHINIDGDNLNSTLAIGHILKKMGKKAYLFINEDIPPNYLFIPFLNNLNPKTPDVYPEATITIECSNYERIPSEISIENLKKTFIINIDHHPDNSYYGDINWVDDKASSVGEMIFRITDELNIELDYELALFIYIAILTDTGGFRFSNTTPFTHLVASKLLNFNLPTSQIYSNIYLKKKLNYLKFEGCVFKNIHNEENGKIVWSNFTNNMLKEYGLNHSDIQNLVEEIAQVEGAEIIVLFKEINETHTKASLRSKKFPVNEIAKKFNGGGHRQAAGCNIYEPHEKAIETCISYIKEIFLNFKEDYKT